MAPSVRRLIAPGAALPGAVAAFGATMLTLSSKI